VGIFSDTCRTLVDPNTGKALKGPALEEARKDRKAPRCGYKVRKAAKFCSKCGTGAPRGWWKCPSCGKWVGNESNFCWSCMTVLHPETRGAVAGGVWQRSPEVLAQRAELGDIKKLLKKGLRVEAGTVAVLLDGGKITDVLEPGMHNLDSLARRINNWGSAPPRTVILVDNGDVVVPLRLEGMRSADEIPVDFYGEIAFHFAPKQAADFVTNLFKARTELRWEEVSDILLSEVRQAVETMCNTSSIEDLIKDPQRRLRFEDQLQETLGQALERYGMALVRVASAEFTGKEYEELRAKAGDLELKARGIEFQQRMRELVSGERMHELKNEQDLNEYVAQLAQEKQIGDRQRDHEFARLKQVQRHELEQDEAAYQMTQEMNQISHEIGQKTKWDEYRWNQAVQDEQILDEIERLSNARERDKVNGWLDVQAKRKGIKREDKREMLEITREDRIATTKGVHGLDLSAIIAATPDPEQRRALLEFNQQQQQVALAAQENAALEQLKAQGERELRENRRISEETLDRFERMAKFHAESLAEAVKGKTGGDVHIVK
jgi:membrane protease subunit (stomatin/prohibitin family)